MMSQPCVMTGNPGSIFLSGAGPGLWYHQHFNVSESSATYLVVGVNRSRRYVSGRWDDMPTDRNTADLSVKQGGIQTEYEDENPDVHAIV